MGGSKADWEHVNALLPGSVLELPATDSFSALIPALAERVESGSFLCGYSMGGRIALLLAEELVRRGNPPAGLALLAAGMGFDSSAEREARLRSDDKWAGFAAASSENFWKEWYRQELFGTFRALPSAKRDAWLASRKSMDSGNLIRQLRHLGPGNHAYLVPYLRSLRENGISVLYLAGELDKKYLELGNLLAEQGLVAFQSIRGAGHILPLEAPEEVASRLKSFIAEEEPRNGKKH